MEKQTYYFVTTDVGPNYFKTQDEFLEFLRNNSSEDETEQVGCKEMTEAEFAALPDLADL